MLDTLFNIFHLQLPKSTDSLFSAKSTFEDDRIEAVMVHKRHDLLENFQTALLIAFNDANLLEVFIFSLCLYVCLVGLCSSEFIVNLSDHILSLACWCFSLPPSSLSLLYFP